MVKHSPQILTSKKKGITMSCMHLLQAAYHAAKPQVLSQQLQQLDLEDDKVSAYISFCAHILFSRACIHVACIECSLCSL